MVDDAPEDAVLLTGELELPDAVGVEQDEHLVLPPSAAVRPTRLGGGDGLHLTGEAVNLAGLLVDERRLEHVVVLGGEAWHAIEHSVYVPSTLYHL